MFRCAQGAVETERQVYANDAERNRARCKAHNCRITNRIRTSKYYSVLDFIPRNLFSQFLRVANTYFLILIILQLIPAISSLNPVTTIVPLVFVLSVTACKDGWDDYQRHKSDRQVNGRAAKALRQGRWMSTTWDQLVVGDIIQLQSDDLVPADIVVLSTSSEEGECYIETADLDGETNLKKRHACKETRGMGDLQSLSSFSGHIIGEVPNNKLEHYQGTLFLGARAGQVPLDNKHVALRGCKLRNTKLVHGLVIFAGFDTKLMQNSGKARFKRTHIDLKLNRLVLFIFLILILLAAICSLFLGLHERSTSGDGFWNTYLPRVDSEKPSVMAFFNFWSAVIILNTVVPISLYVTVEAIRLGQSLFISQDMLMYHEETNTPTVARSTNLSEELGQVDYVFSDKTGTLTQNVMKFKKCSVGGVIYGLDDPPGDDEGNFICVPMQTALSQQQPEMMNFWRLLALCHTVQPEMVMDVMEYQAQSPDEKALVEAARAAGFRFDTRRPDSVDISAQQELETHEILNVIPFTSTRKRMTTIMRSPDGRIFVLCKGADNIIRDRLSPESRATDWPSCEQHLHDFARDGLRTLLLSQKELSQEEYAHWAERYHQASTNTDLKRRGEDMAQLDEEVESNLLYVGCTAIEDKLQDGVPEAIANIMRGGIKVWVLTGDKQETAINIGMSCRLLNPTMEPLFVVNGDTFSEVEEQLEGYLRDMNLHPRPAGQPYALVIDGPSLVFPLPPSAKELKTAVVIDSATGQKTERKLWDSAMISKQRSLEAKFVDVASRCHAVICCRVSPLQKAQVVELIKRSKDAICLSIGDGANDVSMIKAAHIGVGISGLEGRQAVLASDFSIAQFRFLQRLLLVHGRWSYVRMATFLRYFFYKNFAFTLTQFFFAIFCAFTMQTVFHASFISTYNVIFSSLPPIVVGIMEQDISAKNSLKFPFLYEAGPRNVLFTTTAFYRSLLRGTIHSAILFFVWYFTLSGGGSVGTDGQELGDVYSQMLALASTLVVLVNVELAIESSYITLLSAIFYVLGPVLFIVVFGALFSISFSSPPDAFTLQVSAFGTIVEVYGSTTYWASFFLTVALANISSFALRFWSNYFSPTPTSIVREKIRLEQTASIDPKPLSEIDRPDSWDRSSYAFSQDDGATNRRTVPTAGPITPLEPAIEMTPQAGGSYGAVASTPSLQPEQPWL